MYWYFESYFTEIWKLVKFRSKENSENDMIAAIVNQMLIYSHSYQIMVPPWVAFIVCCQLKFYTCKMAVKGFRSK